MAMAGGGGRMPQRPASGAMQTMGRAAPTGTAGGDPWAKTPRNALCPCGSGKKYKHCHGKL
jgi:preprotein translocase subunit SecA